MPKLWRNGRWERVASIERGRMLVHSAREWRALVKRRVGIYGAMIIGIALVTIPILMDGDLVLVLQLGALYALLLYLLGMLLFGWWHLRTGGSTPGVYERGVEVPWGKFIPYGEVMSMERSTRLMGKVLVLQLRPSGRKIILGRMIIGIDGSNYVESMLRSAHPADARQGRPRLVVYPAGDGVGSSLEEGSRGRI